MNVEEYDFEIYSHSQSHLQEFRYERHIIVKSFHVFWKEKLNPSTQYNI